MIGVLIIPTGIEAAIGGHAGDGNPAAKLMASCFDTLITHPNVVNAADVNEMTENTLYVEGSILNRFLEGKIKLQKVKRNKILVVVNPPVKNETINAVSSGRVTIGIDARILELKTPLVMEVVIDSEKGATGNVFGWEELVAQVSGYKFNALAIHTPINVLRDVALNYFRNGGVNPWGGVEAKASKLIADALNKPVAHAPVDFCIDDEELFNIFTELVDPRIAPEAISICYLHCVLKGLHRAPKPVDMGLEGICNNDVDFMISPDGCWGIPHTLCCLNNIPIIIVRENSTILKQEIPEISNVIAADNYWEAAGIVMCMRSGVVPESVRRPLKQTEVVVG